MKKGSLVKVEQKSKYSGQNMKWTETFTGLKTIGVGGEIVTHNSMSKINIFCEKKICVHPSAHSESYFASTASFKEIKSRYNWKNYIYTIFLPEGTIVETFSDDEYRFDLDSSFEVKFAGIITECNNPSDQGDSYLRYSDTVK